MAKKKNKSVKKAYGQVKRGLGRGVNWIAKEGKSVVRTIRKKKKK